MTTNKSRSTGTLVLNNYGTYSLLLFDSYTNIYLGPAIYKKLGFDTVSQLGFQCGWVGLGLMGTIISALIMDRIGRKPLLLIGLAGACISLALEAAMVASFAEAGTNKAGLRMGVGAAYIFTLFYTLAFDSAGFVLFSEIFPNHLRARGMAMVIATIALTDLVYLEVAETVSLINLFF